MHPIGVASAAWVFAAGPSKAPFYVAGAVLVVWSVALAATGVLRPGFPGSRRAGRLVMATSALLVAVTVSSAVATGSGPAAHPAATSLALVADPAGGTSYDLKDATVAAGARTVRLTNASPVPHNVTVASGAQVIAHTATITKSTASTTARLQPGTYVFYCSVDAHRVAGMQGTLTVK
jgi:plastocyanin